jgi:hypothetical protein
LLLLAALNWSAGGEKKYPFAGKEQGAESVAVVEQTVTILITSLLPFLLQDSEYN